jgi:hypothetical protein
MFRHWLRQGGLRCDRRVGELLVLAMLLRLPETAQSSRPAGGRLSSPRQHFPQ